MKEGSEENIREKREDHREGDEEELVEKKMG